MEDSQTPTATLELVKLREALFRRHHVHPRYRADKPRDVVDTLLGLHAARLSSPYVALGCRLNRFAPATLREQLDSGALIKFRCVRKTLHISTTKYSGILHHATLKYRTGDVKKQLGRHGIGARALSSACDWIESVSSASALPVRTLELATANWLTSKGTCSLVGRQLVGVSRLVIKYAWESGFLCYVNRAPRWFNEERCYASQIARYPRHCFQRKRARDADVALLQEYIRAFGPVSIADACWWSGFGRGKVLKAIAAMIPGIVRIRIPGLDSDLWATIERVREIQSVKIPLEDWVALLGHEDPTLKGYFESRDIYVERQYRGELFNPIGEARASIMLNGLVIGVWTWNPRLHAIQLTYFEKQPLAIVLLVSKEAERLAGILRRDSEDLFSPAFSE